MGTRSGETDINEGENLKRMKINNRQAGSQAVGSPMPWPVHVEIAKLAPSQPRPERGRNHRPRKTVIVLAQRSTLPSPAIWDIRAGKRKCRKLPQGAGAPAGQPRLSEPHHTRLSRVESASRELGTHSNRCTSPDLHYIVCSASPRTTPRAC